MDHPLELLSQFCAGLGDSLNLRFCSADAKEANLRRTSGSTIAEFGPALMLCFAVLVFPLFAFGTIGMRYIFLLNAARLAAQMAARSQSFLSDTNATATPPALSAVHNAQNIASMACNQIGGMLGTTHGVTLSSTNVYIKVCPLGGKTTSVTQPAANTPLSAAAQPVSYTYNCEVVLTGSIQPLCPGLKSLVGSIPGLNAPYIAYARADYVFENTNNLNM